MASIRHWAQRHPFLLFVGLAYAITWLLAVPASPMRGNRLLPVDLPFGVMALCGVVLHYGPSIAALLVAGLGGGKQQLRSLLRRALQWHVGLRWYAFVLLFMPLVHLAAVAIHVLLGGTAPRFFSAAEIPAGISPWFLLGPVFLAVLLQAGIAEEIGWRGLALPLLQQRYNALVSSLILGVIWWLWHFHALNWNDLSRHGFEYFLFIMPLTIVFTWLSNSTNGSILMAILFHTVNNVSDWIVPTSSMLSPGTDPRLFVLTTAVIWLVAVVIVVVYGPTRLAATPSKSPTQLQRVPSLGR